MNKKVSFGTKPSAAKATTPNAEAWVKERATDEVEPMRRMTIDIPESLHRRIKSQCALRGTMIANEVRELLLQKFGNQ